MLSRKLASILSLYHPHRAVQVSPPCHKVATAAPGIKLTQHPHRTKTAERERETFSSYAFHQRGEKHFQKLLTGLLTFFVQTGSHVVLG